MNYYNENDPKAAAWLRELIKSNLIPPGHVDERDIQDVKPHELTGYAQQHFFAGIGGWPLALRISGWPDDQPVRTGSCPCQPFSQSGKRLGTKDERHLWPVFRDLISFGEPTITFGEQVASPLGREWLAGVRDDLEGLGYEVGASDLCVASVGSPHIRQRLYWMAHTNGGRLNSGSASKSKRESRHALANDGSEVGGMVLSNERSDFTEKPKCDIASRENLLQKSVVGLVFTNGAGRDSGKSSVATARHGCSAESASGANGMGHANGAGSQGWNERILECDHQWPPGTPNLVVCCEDGKARRFEPGSFPLAHGFPNRVGLLRGYGNGIVPQLAAQFIQASVEAIEMR